MAKNQNTTPRIIIGMPSGRDQMHVSTAHAIGCAIIGDPTIVDFLVYKGCDIVSARTWLVQRALEQKATHLLFVDTDMMFPPDAIKKLLSHKKEIVSVNYHKRKFPLETVVTQLPESQESETELYRAAVAGTGLMLIDLSIIEKLGLPWFSFGRGSKGELVLGEDAWFCHTARDAGYDIWIDPTIKTGHIGEYIY